MCSVRWKRQCGSSKPATAVPSWPALLVRLRQQYGLTQAKAAAEIRISQSLWGLWESGARPVTPSRQLLLRFAFPKAFPKKIVTEVVPLRAFYDAEEYHQDYAEKNPNNPYIQVCDIPKIHALQAQFPELFQDYKHK